MKRPERRRAPRLITRLHAALRGEDGAALDSDAIAHEVSMTGFRVETRGPLSRGQMVRFDLELSAGRRAAGRARVAWARREDSGRWAGLHIERMSWRDRRRLRRELWPPTTDWESIAEKAFTAAFWIAVALAGERLAARWSEWSETLFRLAPALLALIGIGALIEDRYSRRS